MSGRRSLSLELSSARADPGGRPRLAGSPSHSGRRYVGKPLSVRRAGVSSVPGPLTPGAAARNAISAVTMTSNGAGRRGRAHSLGSVQAAPATAPWGGSSSSLKSNAAAAVAAAAWPTVSSNAATTTLGATTGPSVGACTDTSPRASCVGGWTSQPAPATGTHVGLGLGAPSVQGGMDGSLLAGLRPGAGGSQPAVKPFVNSLWRNTFGSGASRGPVRATPFLGGTMENSVDALGGANGQQFSSEQLPPATAAAVAAAARSGSSSSSASGTTTINTAVGAGSALSGELASSLYRSGATDTAEALREEAQRSVDALLARRKAELRLATNNAAAASVAADKASELSGTSG